MQHLSEIVIWLWSGGGNRRRNKLVTCFFLHLGTENKTDFGKYSNLNITIKVH